MQTKTNMTVIAAYGPQPGQVGHRIVRPAFDKISDMYRDWLDSPSILSHLHTETHRDHTNKQQQEHDYFDDQHGMGTTQLSDPLALTKECNGESSDVTPKDFIADPTPEASSDHEVDGEYSEHSRNDTGTPSSPSDSRGSDAQDERILPILSVEEALKIAHDIRDDISMPIEYINLRTK